MTGASGFVGARVMKRLTDIGFEVRGAYRYVVPSSIAGAEGISLCELGDTLDWRTALEGVDVIVHTAARVHVMNDKSANPLAEFRRINVEGTSSLVRQATAMGVKRFIFLSSIKVNGEFTELGHPFTADDVPAPQDPYGVSKHEAEQLLRQITCDTSMDFVNIRAPLVYGSGVKANFDLMMRLLVRGLPLPLAAVTENRRSLVALDNLLDLILTCLSHPAAANQTFLVSDGEDLSTAQLLKRMGDAMGFPARLFYMEPSLLKLGAKILNNTELYQRLCGSLQLDISKTRQLLDWTPSVSVDEGLRFAAEGFKQ